jgi:hypothetical protein
MTPQQQVALEALVGRALTEDEVAQVAPLVAAGATQAIADILSVGRKRVVSMRITERGVRMLPVLPRSRHALLQVLRDAAQSTPAWLAPVLTAAGVPAEDHPALADDLSSAHGWLLNADGLDIGTAAARNMLDMIAAAVPAAAAACAAVKAMAEEADPVTHTQVGYALQQGGE